MKESREILRTARRVHKKRDFGKAGYGLYKDLLPEIWLLFRDHLLQD